jgi:hypothetical protein
MPEKDKEYFYIGQEKENSFFFYVTDVSQDTVYFVVDPKTEPKYYNISKYHFIDEYNNNKIIKKEGQS